jgi:TniQ
MAAAGVGVRTLPLRVAPLTGEALDSWLEALAARHQVPVGDVLARCQLSFRAPVSGWIAALTTEQLDHIGQMGGVAPQTIVGMTLQAQARRLAVLEPCDHVPRVLWIRRTGSRMCRWCLGETDGRWQLRWRLNWSFACPQHRCLLCDACPRCGRPQRRQLHRLTTIPQSGRCAQMTESASPQPAQPCLASLADGAVTSISDGHPILHAQKRIDALLAGQATDLALYGARPPSPAVVLRDVHRLARWIITSVNRGAVAQILGSVLVQEIAPPDRARTWPIRRTLEAANPSVHEAAAAITVALTVLGQPSRSTAVALLCGLMTEVGGVDLRHPPVPANRPLSPAARAVHDAAYASAKAQRQTLDRLARSAARVATAMTPQGPRWAR